MVSFICITALSLHYYRGAPTRRLPCGAAQIFGLFLVTGQLLTMSSAAGRRRRSSSSHVAHSSEVAPSARRAAQTAELECPQLLHQSCSFVTSPRRIGAPAFIGCMQALPSSHCAAAQWQCCANGSATCLQTALSICSEMPACRAVAQNSAWGVRIYGASYGPVTVNSNWNLHIKLCAGCTDYAALNYNALATEDDGSCQHILGCLRAENLAYNPNATKHDEALCNASTTPPPAPINSPAAAPGAVSPSACAQHDLMATAMRLISLTRVADCHQVLQNGTAPIQCSTACAKAVEAEGVFNSCNRYRGRCLTAVDQLPHAPSWRLRGKVLLWRAACFGDDFDPCVPATSFSAREAAQRALDAQRAAEVVARSAALAHETEKARNAIQGVALTATLVLDGGTRHNDGSKNWDEMRTALAATLRISEAGLLLLEPIARENTAPSWEVRFVILDDPASDRAARQVYTELLKRVESAAAGGEDQTALVLPPPWRAVKVSSVQGLGLCLVDTVTGLRASACLGSWAVATQMMALVYHSLVALTLATAVAIHYTEVGSRWFTSSSAEVSVAQPTQQLQTIEARSSSDDSFDSDDGDRPDTSSVENSGTSSYLF
jgi:hypothetical protein